MMIQKKVGSGWTLRSAYPCLVSRGSALLSAPYFCHSYSRVVRRLLLINYPVFYIRVLTENGTRLTMCLIFAYGLEMQATWAITVATSRLDTHQQR